MADGFKYAVRLDHKADVPRVIEEFIRFEGPAFLEVMIDRDAGVYPMVGPGQGYDEMITGEHIPSRTAGRDQDAGRLRDVLAEFEIAAPTSTRLPPTTDRYSAWCSKARAGGARAFLQQLDRY